MATVWLRMMLVLLIMSIAPKNSDGQLEQWCIANEHTPDDVLQKNLEWACGQGGADCSKIQMGQNCYLPNTVGDHASFAFNDYYQKFKHKGGSCNFGGAGIYTDVDPSHGPCQFEYIP